MTRSLGAGAGCRDAVAHELSASWSLLHNGAGHPIVGDGAAVASSPSHARGSGRVVQWPHRCQERT